LTLLVLVGGAALQADPAADRAKALAGVLTGLPSEAAPIRVRVTGAVPPSRTRAKGEPEESVLAGSYALLESIAGSAGFVVVEDRVGIDSPVLGLEVIGTESIEEGSAAKGEGVGKRPGLTAIVRGHVSLTRVGHAGWVVPLEGRAVRTLASASEALKLDAPYVSALARAGLMEALLDLVRARGRGGAPAVLYAYADSDWPWRTLPYRALDLFDEHELADWMVRLLPDERSRLAEAAAELLPDLGAAALEKLVAAPRDGGVLYRWRRLLVLRQIHAVEPNQEAIAPLLREALGDRAQLVRVCALRGLAEVEGRAAGETLVAALEDPRPSVVHHARLLLQGLAGKDLGTDASAWRTWLAQAAPTAAGPASAPASTLAQQKQALLPFGPRPRRGAPPAHPTVKSPDGLAPALARIAKEQMPDGVWPAYASGFDSCEIGVTAICLLAYFAAGYGTSADEPYAVNVERGLGVLLRAQAQAEAGDRAGYIGETYHGLEAAHALATLALINAWSARPSGTLHTAAQNALHWISKARNPYFGWRYGMKPGDNDTFITTLMMLAIRAAGAANQAAQLAQLPPPFVLDPQDVEGAGAWYDKMTADDGVVGYVVRGLQPLRYKGEPAENLDDPKPRLTLVAPVALHELLQGTRPDQPPLTSQLRLMAAQPPTWPPAYGRADLLGWWQAGITFGRIPKDKHARAWESAVGPALTRMLAATDDQLRDGERWGWICGEAYVLALGVLTVTAKDFLPPLEPGRPDLARVAQDAKASPATRGRALAGWCLSAPAKAEPVLTKLLADPDPALRTAAAGALRARAEAGSGDLTALVKGFVNLDPAGREAAVAIAAKHAAQREDARAILVTALGDALPVVRTASARAWPPGVPLPEVARDVLLQHLGSSDADLVVAALEALAREPGALTLARLTPVAKHAQPRARAAALGAAARLDAPAPERLALLEGARGDTAVEVRRAVATGLGAAGSGDTVVALTALLADADEGTAAAARDALVRLAATQPRAIEALVEGLVAPAPNARLRAAEGLARVGPPAAAHADKLHQAIKAEVGRGEKRDEAALVALAEARWAVTRDANAVAGLLQGIVSSMDTPLEALVRAIELMGSLPELSEQGQDDRVFRERVRRGPIALAMLNAIADHGVRGAHHQRLVEYYLEGSAPGSEHHAHAAVALRRIQGK
jgi:hypothetical protein